jgi:YhcN/YlaJ family sporulation lipoprotein
MLSSKTMIKSLVILSVLVLLVFTAWLYIRKYQFKQQAVPVQQVQSQLQSKTKNHIKFNKSAADRILQLKGVRQVTVLVMRGYAYVAVVLDTNYGQLTYDLENQIAHQVHLTNPIISRVNVSTDSDFVNCFNTYVKDVEQGKSVEGFNEKFNELVDKNFPRYR